MRFIKRHKIFILAGLVVLAYALLILVMTGAVTIRGWDIAAGSNTSYCGLYLPHLDLYCETAR